MNKIYDIHLPALEPLLCALCAQGLLHEAARVNIICASGDGRGAETQSFSERGSSAIAGLAWLVAQLYENRDWVRVEMNTGFVGIYAVTTINGTAVCAHHIAEAFTVGRLPVRSVIR
jgi:hypothetical protein